MNERKVKPLPQLEPDPDESLTRSTIHWGRVLGLVLILAPWVIAALLWALYQRL